MRLIDADDAKRTYTAGLFDTEEDFERVNDIFDYAPTVDAEVVTRCKNCLHYDMGVCLKIYSDGNVHAAAWQMRKPEDFCSYGDRRYVPRCSRGQRGPLAVCPVCGGFDTSWDPDTDESFCKSCGFSTRWI